MNAAAERRGTSRAGAAAAQSCDQHRACCGRREHRIRGGWRGPSSEPESLLTTRLTGGDDLLREDLADLAKDLSQVVFGHAVRQVSALKFLGHGSLMGKKTANSKVFADPPLNRSIRTYIYPRVSMRKKITQPF